MDQLATSNRTWQGDMLSSGDDSGAALLLVEFTGFAEVDRIFGMAKPFQK